MAKDIWDMSDEELEAQFHEAKADMDSPETVYEETYEEDPVEDEIVDNGGDDLEQPDEDSDYETSDVEATEGDSNDSSDSEETPDGDDLDEEEELDEDEDEDEETPQPVQRQKFKANGRDYEFTIDEIINQFPKVFGQAMDYTKKTQAMKPWRKTIDALESAQLGQDEVNLMIDVLKGDKGAIAEVLKKNNIDALELDTEGTKYTPKDYGRDESTLAIHDVIDSIKDEPEFVVTNKVLSKEWDDASFKEVTRDPDLIRLLHVDVKSGMYDKVQPIAEKLKVYDRGKQSDLDYYKQAAKLYFNDLDSEKMRLDQADRTKADREMKMAEKAKIAQIRAEEAKVKAVREESAKRKAAAPTKKVAGTRKVTNYLDESDEAFEDWYKKLPTGM